MRRGTSLGALLCLASAAPAAAHGLTGDRNLPVPSWLFGWAAALALALSFAALAFGWREPRLARARERAIGRLPAALSPLGGLLGLALFVLTVDAGLNGTLDNERNLAPTMVFVIFWVGTAVLSLLVGDVFAVLNPWRAVGRAVGWATRRAGLAMAPYPYPARLGQWPAVAGLLAFAWLELASPDRGDPRFLAYTALAYAGLQLCGMAFYGERAWSANGDAFAVYFRLFARLSPLRWERGRVSLRAPAVGALAAPVVAGSTAFVLTSIGTTSFDGFSAGPLWSDVRAPLVDAFGATGAATVGLLAWVAIVALLYRAGVEGVRNVDRRRDARELAQLFAHSLIPIAAAYVFAHYFTLLTEDGQAVVALLSDPRGHGADLFGTAGFTGDRTWIGATAIWYVQVGALLAGHVAGLALAHDRALELYRDGRAATRSQYWMLAVMVGFTSLGLWLLSIGER